MKKRLIVFTKEWQLWLFCASIIILAVSIDMTAKYFWGNMGYRISFHMTSLVCIMGGMWSVKQFRKVKWLNRNQKKL